MATVSTQGKVNQYPYGGNPIRILCTYDPTSFVWRGNTVRTSGSNISKCNIQTRMFDVTVDPQTAALLVAGYVFVLEYDDRVHPGLGANERLVTKFAGYPINIDAAA
ncbi:MAG TPA: hypothetical protein VMG12_11155 [Polyangiaceae bacterium]|nr:hypothetical protein [Polyangiaceae bacterium]